MPDTDTRGYGSYQLGRTSGFLGITGGHAWTSEFDAGMDDGLPSRARASFIEYEFDAPEPPEAADDSLIAILGPPTRRNCINLNNGEVRRLLVWDIQDASIVLQASPEYPPRMSPLGARSYDPGIRLYVRTRLAGPFPWKVGECQWKPLKDVRPQQTTDGPPA